MNKNDSINNIITSLANYFEQSNLKVKLDPTHPQIIHYINEIIRFKSKLNFIINKTKRFLRKDKFIDSNDEARYFYATYRILWESTSIDSIKKELEIKDDFLFISFLRKLKSFSWSKALENKSEVEKLSIKEAVPTFFINHLLPVISLNFIKENIQAMNNYNDINECTIRLNTLKGLKEQNTPLVDIYQYFKKLGIKYREDQDISELIYVPIKKKEVLINSRFYRDGIFTFQDKASTAVVNVLDPKPEEFICDMCAAPGMKTSLIAQYSNNKARIISGEFLNTRAIEAKKMLEHLNVSNYDMINTDSIKFPIRFDKKFDKVLLDAPCTGSGTFLSNPELKWRQNEKFLHQNVILQKKLLESALGLLKPGGIFVYSTCSFYPEEGELQIQDVFNQLKPVKIPDWISKSYSINGSILPGTGRLYPSTHGTQAFFIGKFKKVI
ncbi:MAG: methyltransferase domain-containing protein [Promethearchaeota archaeon]